ncbi:MAG TPA: Crp/Fnr family transcriptional regulator [Bacteroidales bacterium]|nr:Crp/Fnr family transcriptional regulator [Bacteroidales bacterium]
MPEVSHEKQCKECTLDCVFSSVHAKELSGFQNYKREIIFRKGETLVKQGSIQSTILFINEGFVKHTIEGYHNKDVIIRLSGKNEYIGLNLLSWKNESLYTTEALKKTRVCMIESSYFRKLYTNYPVLFLRLFTNFSEELDYLYERLKIIGTRNMQGKLASALLYLSDYGQKQEDIYSHITRKDLAELSGMSVESMVRMLNEFKHEKLIQIKGKNILLNNPDMVRILCRVG